MNRLKVLFVGILFSLLFILGINVISSGEVEVSLKQQESSELNGSIRYVGTISGVSLSDIKNYSVSIKMYNTSGSLVKSNTKDYTTLYDKVSGVSEVATNNVYYAVFTLTSLDSYSGYKLDCYFSFNLENGEKYETNHKYFEIGTNYSISALAYAGYDEGCYMEFSPYNNDTEPSNYIAEYRDLSSSTWKYTTIDTELIRYSDNKLRVDMVGLSEGNYTLRVSKVVNGTKYVTDEVVVTVTKSDRSGYAHFGYSSGVGAYNNDGTLKSGAVVVYVNDSNKNTVTVTISGKTYTGLVNILQAQSKSSVPLDIRILDVIKTNQWNVKSDSPRLADNSNSSVDANFWNNTLETTYGDNLAGLTMIAMDKKELVSYKWLTTVTGLKAQANGTTSSKTTEYKGTEYPELKGKKVYDDDSYWNMLDITGASNVTVEGIGENAGTFQWGFTWKNCNSIEIKNLSFTDYTEDACSFEGGSVTSYGNYWFHNNEINRGKNNWDVSGERDKYAGDGGIDLKKVHNVTMSYCHVNNSKKTGLVGGSDSDLTMSITFHHNYYENVESRLPLGRQANMHFYNNYYYNCSTAQDIRGNAFVLSENNYFYNCKNAQKVAITSTYTGTAIKSVNDYYEGTCNSMATKTTRTDTSISGNCKPDGSTDYTNFDTNASLFYYDSVNKVSDVELLETAAEAKNTCIKYAGVLNSNHYNPVIINSTPSTGNTEEDTPTVTTTIVHNFTTDGKDSTTFSITGNLSTSKGTVTYNNLTLTQCLKMESSTSITFTASSACKLTLVFVETAPTIKIDGTKNTGTSNVMTIELSSGSHTITKAGTANLFYIVLTM